MTTPPFLMVKGGYFTGLTHAGIIRCQKVHGRIPWPDKEDSRSTDLKQLLEGLIGSIRRECLNDIIVLNEPHLRRMLQSYVDYYHHWRPHRSLEMDAPEPRAVQPPELGSVKKLPEVGGFHHHYERTAA